MFPTAGSQHIFVDTTVKHLTSVVTTSGCFPIEKIIFGIGCVKLDDFPVVKQVAQNDWSLLGTFLCLLLAVVTLLWCYDVRLMISVLWVQVLHMNYMNTKMYLVNVSIEYLPVLYFIIRYHLVDIIWKDKMQGLSEICINIDLYMLNNLVRRNHLDPNLVYRNHLDTNLVYRNHLDTVKWFW